jgi:PST family polysaccharide transporter
MPVINALDFLHRRQTTMPLFVCKAYKQPLPTQLKTKPPATTSEKQEEAPKAQSSGNSYGQILRSSSIIGGSTGVNYVIGMLRTKAVAVLLGPSGVGLVGMYVSIAGLVSTLSQLGTDQSGVREIAEANSSGDPKRLACVTISLRRICFLMGVLGWAACVALSWPLSQWTFGTPERAWQIAILGSTVLLGVVSLGQSAQLKGMRKIGDIARIQIIAAILNTIVAIGLYFWLHEKGILPVIISTAVIQFVATFVYSRRIKLADVPHGWTDFASDARLLVGRGVVFMYDALLAGILGLTIRSIIVANHGLNANGMYQAAWALSGLFAGFIIGAIALDFYPRLTAVAQDNEEVNRLVNEQIEIGILLALPGILGTLGFAPWLMRLFYSAEFLAAAELLPWFALGIFSQVITNPLSFIQRAKARSGWIFFSQSHQNVLHGVLGFFLIKAFGLLAASWAFAITMYVHGIVVWQVARHLSAFTWKKSSLSLIASAACLIIIGLTVQLFSKGMFSLLAGAVVTIGASVFSLRGLSRRLGEGHRIVRMARRFPGGRFLCGF